MFTCTDSDCGREFPRDMADVDLGTDFTEPDSPLDNWSGGEEFNVEFGIDVKVTISCPECGEQVAEFSGDWLNVPVPVHPG